VPSGLDERSLEERELQRIDVAPDASTGGILAHWRKFLLWLTGASESKAAEESREAVGRALGAAPDEMVAFAARQHVANQQKKANTAKALSERRAADGKERREEALFDLEVEQRKANIEKTKAETAGQQLANVEKLFELAKEKGYAIDANVVNGVPQLIVVDIPTTLSSSTSREEVEITENVTVTASNKMPPSDESSDWDPILERLVIDLEYTEGVLNKLKQAQVTFIGDLVQIDEAGLLRGGLMSMEELTEVKDVLASRGLSLGMRFNGWDQHRKTLRRNK